MILTLKNFRCHVDRTFELPDEGLIALVGSSGAGKSTIFSAIVYALYGKIPGKNKKPYTHGKNTAAVTLEYQGMYIHRTSRPCVVTVTFDEVEYEDDAAQSIINTQMSMTYEEFLVAAYILQRSNASVLSLTPTEQVAFVEVLADSNPHDKREDIKARIKLVNEEKVGFVGELKALRSALKKLQDQYPEPPDTPEPIENGVDLDEVRQEISAFEAELDDAHSQIEAYSNELSESRASEKKLTELRAKIEKLEIEISQLEQLKSNLEENPTDEGMAADEATMEEKTSELETNKVMLGYFDEKQRFDEALAASNEANTIKKTKLEKEFDGTDLKELDRECHEAEEASKAYEDARARYDYQVTKKQEARDRLMEIFKSVRTVVKGSAGIKKPAGMIDFLKDQISNVDEKIASLKKKACVRWSCPCCKAAIGMTEDRKLVALGDDDTAESKPRAKEKIQAEEEKLHTLNGLVRDIEALAPQLNAKCTDPGEPPEDPLAMKMKLHKLTKVKEELDAIDSGALSLVLQRMKTKLDALEETAEGHDQTTREEVQANLTAIDADISTLASSLERQWQTRSEHSAYETSITSKKKALRLLRKGLPTGKTTRIAEIENAITELTRSLVSITTEITSRREVLEICSDYEAYLTAMLAIETAQEDVTNKEAEIKGCDETLEGLMGLDDAIKEAEVLSLEKTVRSINEHARIYLDQMFDDPIIVKLDIIETKGAKVKLKLNTVIEYKGNTYNDIEELSGGERQRCDMAFLLAVNDMLGSNILMLDECLNNLDESINTNVLSLIKEMCDHKLILVISHEAIEGLFDENVAVVGASGE